MRVKPHVPVILKTENRVIQQQFDSCLYLAKALIYRKFSVDEADRYFVLNEGSSGLDYGSNVISVSDTLTGQPLGYRLNFDFILDQDTIGAFSVDLSADIQVKYYRYYHLQAFRAFADGDLVINKEEAKKLATENGVKSKSLEPIFRCSRDYPDTLRNDAVQYYWDASSDCNQCLTLKIDAKTGQVFDKGRVVVIY